MKKSLPASSTRSYYTATLLPDGRVLLAGGAENAGKSVQSTILFNPSTGSFSAGPTMTTARERHAAILLANGKVLIAGGRNGSGSLKSAEVCDANACTAVTGQMAQARYGHAIEMSPAIFVGPVVIGGADSAATVEAFAGDGFVTLNLPSGPPVTMRSARRDLTATLLPDNRLLVTGGLAPNGSTKI